MNRTLHYGLPIFEASDKPSILVDFNQAMHDIDENMFLIATGGDSSVAEAIAALQQGLASVTNQIAIINQTLGTKLDTSFMNNLAAEFDRTMSYFKYDFVFADGNLYQCIEDYDPNTSSFDICFTPIWLCNSVAKAEADLEELSDDYDALEARVTTLENAPGYSLPAATTSTLGGIIVGNGLSVSASGVLDAVPAGISPATASTLGGVKIGSGVNVAADGTISVPPGSINPATSSTIGGVKIGEGVSIDTNDALNGYIVASVTPTTYSTANYLTALNEIASAYADKTGLIKFTLDDRTFNVYHMRCGLDFYQICGEGYYLKFRKLNNAGINPGDFNFLAYGSRYDHTYTCDITYTKNGTTTTLTNRTINVYETYMEASSNAWTRKIKMVIQNMPDFDSATFTITGFNRTLAGIGSNNKTPGATYSICNNDSSYTFYINRIDKGTSYSTANGNFWFYCNG